MNDRMKVGGGRAPKVAQAEVEAPKRKRAAKAKKAAAVEPLRDVTIDEIRALGGGKPAQDRPKRFRFAPSPTGHLHIGGARTALMNYLAAKKMGGEFVLRIEDTDQRRSKPEYTEAILKGLTWLGMDWVGEPIYQSQRTEIYKQKIQKLLDEGKAYRDNSGAIFFKMPKEGQLQVQDRVKGTVTINIQDADGNADFVVQRSDGSPTFLLANVVDDGEQGITHIIRGDDHLNNAARQSELFKALGYEVPEFYHVPLIHGDQKLDPETGEMKKGGKLSKRDGATSVMDYELMGYDPTVLVNHLARLGMNFGTDQTLSVEDLAKRFDHLGFSKSATPINQESLGLRQRHQLARTDTKKVAAQLKDALKDGDHLRAYLNAPGTDYRPDFMERTGVHPDEAPALFAQLDANALEAAADGAKSRVGTMGEVIDMVAFFRAPPAYSEQGAAVHQTPKMKKLMGELMKSLEAVPAKDWSLKNLDAKLEEFNKKANVGYRAYGEALRWMLTGLSDGLPLHNTLALLGREEALKRLADRTA